MKTLTMISAINDAMKSEMRTDESVIVYGEDVGYEGGVFRATVDLQKEFGDKRCFDSPLAENAIAGTALGLSITGWKPIVEMQFSGFVYPAFNQIVSHISRFRNRTRGEMPLPLVIRMPYGGGIRALEHHSESMEALFGHIPGIKVVIPSTPYDAKGLLISAIRDPDPVIFMEPKRIYRSVKQEIPEETYVIPIGKAKLVYPGENITLVSYGAQMKETLEAYAKLKAKGISADLIDLRTIYPYDQKTILESVLKTGRILVVQEGPTTFSVASEILSFVISEAFTSLQAPPAKLAGADTIYPLPKGEKYYMLDSDTIVNKALELIRYQP